MIDYFALALTHGLIAIMVFRLSSKPELDREQAPPAPVAAQQTEPGDA